MPGEEYLQSWCCPMVTDTAAEASGACKLSVLSSECRRHHREKLRHVVGSSRIKLHYLPGRCDRSSILAQKDNSRPSSVFGVKRTSRGPFRPNLLCPGWNTFIRHGFESHNKSLADVQNKRLAIGRHDLIGGGALISARHAIRWRACDCASASSRSGKGEREKAAAATDPATAGTGATTGASGSTTARTATTRASGAAAPATAGTGATTGASGSTTASTARTATTRASGTTALAAAASGAAAPATAGTGATTGASGSTTASTARTATPRASGTTAPAAE